MEYVLVFPDTGSAIKSESCLLGAGVKVSVMPLPESIGSGCGITLRVEEGLLGCALSVLQESGVTVSAVYSRQKTPLGYEYMKA